MAAVLACGYDCGAVASIGRRLARAASEQPTRDRGDLPAAAGTPAARDRRAYEHDAAAARHRVVDGIRCTTVARTLLDLGRPAAARRRAGVRSSRGAARPRRPPDRECSRAPEGTAAAGVLRCRHTSNHIAGSGHADARRPGGAVSRDLPAGWPARAGGQRVDRARADRLRRGLPVAQSGADRRGRWARRAHDSTRVRGRPPPRPAADARRLPRRAVHVAPGATGSAHRRGHDASARSLRRPRSERRLRRPERERTLRRPERERRLRPPEGERRLRRPGFRRSRDSGRARAPRRARARSRAGGGALERAALSSDESRSSTEPQLVQTRWWCGSVRGSKSVVPARWTRRTMPSSSSSSSVA